MINPPANPTDVAPRVALELAEGFAARQKDKVRYR